MKGFPSSLSGLIFPGDPWIINLIKSKWRKGGKMKGFHRSLVFLLAICGLVMPLLWGMQQSAADEEAAAWKKLGKARIRSGIWLSQAGTFRWGFHLKEIREVLEKTAFDRPVTIVIILDGGMRVDLGTYQPQVGEGDPPAITWPTVPEVREMDIQIQVTPGETYRIMFLDTSGKQRASIITRVILI